MPELSDPTVISATIKAIKANFETGAREIVLSVPQSDAVQVARLSVYDRVVFSVQFTPVDAETRGARI